MCAPNTEHFFQGTPKNRLPSIQDDTSSVASSKIGNTKNDLGGVKVSPPLFSPSKLLIVPTLPYRVPTTISSSHFPLFQIRLWCSQIFRERVQF